MRLGITGHQRLEDPTAWAWVANCLAAVLSEAEPPIVGITSLAIGADQLFASLVVHHGGRIHVIMPFAGYERTFDEEHLDTYRNLLAKAVFAEILPKLGTDQEAFLAAGKRVVELSDLMVAVWNGQPAKGRGGTGDIVAFATERRVPLVHINPSDRTVIRT